MTQIINQRSLDKNGIYKASIGHILKKCGLRIETWYGKKPCQRQALFPATGSSSGLDGSFLLKDPWIPFLSCCARNDVLICAKKQVWIGQIHRLDILHTWHARQQTENASQLCGNQPSSGLNDNGVLQHDLLPIESGQKHKITEVFSSGSSRGLQINVVSIANNVALP